MTIEKCLDIIQATSTVRYGQTVLIAVGVVLWVIGLAIYRRRTRNRKYKP